jgi:O-methyltransferase
MPVAPACGRKLVRSRAFSIILFRRDWPMLPSAQPAPAQLPSAQEIVNKIGSLRYTDVSPVGGLAQGVIISEATYAPWLEDREFLATFHEIKANTVVDFYRCYELWQLARQTAHLDGDILEVGVYKGGTGCLLARVGSQGERMRHVFLCDTYAGIVKAGPQDTYFKGGELADTSVALVKGLVDKLGLPNVSILQGIFPDDTAAAVADKTFSFCHIDVDVYLSAQQVLDWVWPRLSVGAIVVFDDYGFSTCDGVTKLVNERIGKMKAVTLYNLNGHAIMIKMSA